jgi:hypothetical protein
MTSLIMEPNSQPWDGVVSSIFRIDPNEHPNSLFGIDHLFLMTHDLADSSFTLRWNLADADDAVALTWYYKTAPTSPDSTQIVSLANAASGQGAYQWDMSSMASGTYYLSCVAYDGRNAVTHNARGMLILNRKPTMAFIHPDETDHVAPGGDFATDVLGDPWDMSSADDVDLIGGFHPDSTTWTQGVFHGVSQGTDPYLLWLPSSPIEASTHPILSFCMFLDDPDDRDLNAVINWYANGQWSWTNAIPVSEGWNVYSVDMAGYSGWSGDVSRLRLDPVYLSGVAIELDWVRVPVPGSSSFAVTWNDSDPDDDALIDLYAFQGSWQGARMVLAQGLSENAGADWFTWDVSFLPSGAYYILASVDDGINAPDTVFAPHPLNIQDAPLDPLLLSGSLNANGILTLTWSVPQGNVAEYHVFRAPVPYFSPSPTRLVGTVPFWQSSYAADLDDAWENPNLNYFFRVTWVTAQQIESPPSNTVGEFDIVCGP